VQAVPIHYYAASPYNYRNGLGFASYIATPVTTYADYAPAPVTIVAATVAATVATTYAHAPFAYTNA
jgi:hypothetical protein